MSMFKEALSGHVFRCQNGVCHERSGKDDWIDRGDCFYLKIG